LTSTVATQYWTSRGTRRRKTTSFGHSVTANRPRFSCSLGLVVAQCRFAPAAPVPRRKVVRCTKAAHLRRRHGSARVWKVFVEQWPSSSCVCAPVGLPNVCGFAPRVRIVHIVASVSRDRGACGPIRKLAHFSNFRSIASDRHDRRTPRPHTAT
jgi:hypothetical protein